MRVLYRPAALNDLEQIYDFTFEMWGPAQAEHYLAQLRSAAQRLLVHPRSGRVYEMEGQKYRSLRSGRHLIFYRIEADAIVVVRILHDRMDIPSRLTGND